MPTGKPFVDWLVDRLYRAGTRRLFGVPGGGTSLDLIAAAKQRGMAMVLTAREDAAVIMAGVSGVLSEAPGLAFTTKGPGLASAANGLASASLDRMPVLLLAETFAPGEMDYVSHQVFDQEALVAPLLQRGGSDVLAASAEAVEDWLGQGPAPIRAPAVMFPTSDALRRPVQLTGTVKPAPEQQPHDDDGVRQARKRLAESCNPVVVIGLEAARAALEKPLRRLVERVNAPALTTYMASGVMPFDHPNNAGIFTGGAIEQPCVDEAYLIVLIGLDPVELIRKPWPYRAPVLDICEVARQPHYLKPTQRLLGPLSDSLAALLPDDDGPPRKVRRKLLESVRRLYVGLQSFRSMSRMDASLMKASALRLRFSQSLASRRQRLSQAMVRSTTQRLGWTTKPFTRSDRLTISVSRSGRMPARAR